MPRSRKDHTKRDSEEGAIVNRKRLIIMGMVASIMIVALMGRLFYIQIMKNDLYTTEVNKQRNISIPLSSGRGIIYDRNLIPLTDRTEETIGVIFPQLFQSNRENLSFLSSLTGVSTIELNSRIKRAKHIMEIPMKQELDWNDRRLVNTRGFFVIEKRSRYDTKNLLSHVIGYIGLVDKRGMSGLERSMEDVLAGQGTKSIAAVLDGRKRLLPGEGYTVVNTNKDEKHIKLTVDYHIQAIVEAALDKQESRGAVVVSDVETGEILAMASRPNFNPYNISKHLNSKGDELFNKGIQMTFPPGSIFKIVVAAAALEEGLVDLDEVFFCDGVEEVGNVAIRCNSHSQGGNGEITFQEAFANSCNSTFIQVGQRIGAEKIMEMAEHLGFNHKLNIGLIEEEKGNLPTGDYLKGPAIGNISIGQGQIEATPLQINQLTQIIANGGRRRTLYLIDEVVNNLQEKVEMALLEEVKVQARQFEKEPLKKETIKKLQYMMGLVMQKGTGKGIGEELAKSSAGKTGTAQSTEKGQSVLHAWFTGYYPTDKPKYAVTVFLQNGRSGGGNAVPVFREIVVKMKELGY
ncbi:peptidoglycan D,D-transpeptidase FtsI family protein [Alkaliphilus hydrothermalis]|uniref:Peptidoglycan glycosyltransferase/penicillin-binding protein 2 n=1 Tax=Alkaliphilus hydrothermalis TaxID=1482730 RepID=A0ABS2NM02_9FIRM|nr:penicillin-binding transpeptidase domain-containing protein [Alkaliphilus hydrothermalis]MBM7613966.1 peptidoglycan glycosyltransferase/penicillin-binding protein 2 [Alkaliphilus hydrothermalis]